MMYKGRSLVTAEAVIERTMHELNSLEGYVAKIPKEDIYFFTVIVDAYQNGREQGLVANPSCYAYRDAYYVCKARHSDSEVCIYKGPSSSQGISNEAYENVYSFSTIEKASTWLVKQLVNGYLAYLAKKKETEELEKSVAKKLKSLKKKGKTK
jgi:hypothetical protein